MKLHYFDQASNFGDALNPWLWPRLVPDLLDEDSSSIFVGIGTSINSALPATSLKVVAGAGVGYGSVPTIDQSWRIYWVRGPRSAQALGLDAQTAITDAAVLLRTVPLPQEPKRYRASFIPHWQSALCWDWGRQCELAGVHFIDPLAPVDTVLAEILASELVLAEAMHGAIVADALRVPWVPIRAYHHVVGFKWLDWCQSLGLRYEPHTLPSLYTTFARVRMAVASMPPGPRKAWAEGHILGESAMARTIRRAIMAVDPCNRRIIAPDEAQTTQALHTISATASPILSSDAAIDSATERLVLRFRKLTDDWRSGRLTNRWPRVPIGTLSQ